MITQGTFAHLPGLTDDEIEARLAYAVGRGWAVSVEMTSDPHPRNVYWDRWGIPLFDVTDPRAVLTEIAACRAAFPHHYVKVNVFDARKGRETIVLSFLVQRPADEPGVGLQRLHAPGRTNRYTLHAYAADRPHGERYVGQ